MAVTKKPRGADDFATLDEVLGEQGTREKFQATAVKEVLTWQMEQAMREQKPLRNKRTRRVERRV